MSSAAASKAWETRRARLSGSLHPEPKPAAPAVSTPGPAFDMDLTKWDFIVVNSSAGKDSQAMLDYVFNLALAQGVETRIVVAHADLGKVEWKGTRDLAERQAKHYGARFEVVKRLPSQKFRGTGVSGDLLQHVRERKMWPSSTTRYCTSDHKRGQIMKLFTQLALESFVSKPVRILNCMGMRAQESPARSKLTTFERNDRASNGRRDVWTWLPIHGWTVEQVWDRIRQSGVEHHKAYDLGMPRLSCVFCIFSPKSALLLAGKHNPELLDEYVKVEAEIGHSFRKDFKIAEIQEQLAAGVEPTRVQDWVM